ncbi:MAG: hypothetical protein OXN80_09045 [bacterium]|nr:hypothetical protein [bacterium]
MAEPLRLSEYETGRVRLSRSQARAFIDTGFVEVSPDGEPGWWQVTASHHVGTLVVDDLRIYIKPKIKLENLFLLLSVGLQEGDWMRSATRYATDADLLPAVISFFTSQVDRTLAKGIYRSYREEKDRLHTVRGRIDIPTQITRAGVIHPVDCRFVEYTVDVAENRYLKAAVRRALRVRQVLPGDRRRLLRTLVALEEAKDVAVRPESIDRIGFNRLNDHYQPTLRLARLLLENLTLKDDPGETQATSFMVDMNLLFERYVTNRLEEALRSRLEVKDQYGTHLDWAGRVHIRPDLVFSRRGDVTFVADLKYRVVGNRWGSMTSDLYQILAYATALDLPEGVLIYCRDLDSDGFRCNAVTVRHSSKVLHVWGVDMSGPPSKVEGEIQVLADWIADRANRAVPPLSPVVSVAS